MSELPGDLLYTREHEWLRREDDGNVSIGVAHSEQYDRGVHNQGGQGSSCGS